MCVCACLQVWTDDVGGRHKDLIPEPEDEVEGQQIWGALLQRRKTTGLLNTEEKST